MNKKVSITLIIILLVAACAFAGLFLKGQGDNRELNDKLLEAQQKTETLAGELDDAKARVEALTGDLGNANTQIDTLNGELTTANEKAETLTKDLEASKAETASAQELAEAATAEKTALSAELERFKVKQTELETELATNSEALTQANSELESVKADLADKNTQIENITGELDEAKSQLATAQSSGTAAPVTVPDSLGTYDATKFFTAALDEKGIKYTYEGVSDENGDVVTSVWTLKEVDVKFVILFKTDGRIYMRAFNVIDYNAANRGAVLEILNKLNNDYLFVNWTVDDSDNSVTAQYDLPSMDAQDAGTIGYLAMDSMVDVVNAGMEELKPYMK